MQPVLLNLGTCKACGTNNPSLPGAGLVEKCSGCGGSLVEAHPMPPQADLAFTHVSEMRDAGSEAAERRGFRMRKRVARRMAMIGGDLGGMGAPGVRGNYKGEDCKRVRKHK